MPAPKDFPEMWAAVLRELRTLRATMNHLLDNSGIHLTAPGQFEIDGTVTVTGDFIAEGKISNDALVNPTSPAAVFDYVQNFALSTTLTNIKTTTVTVPAGFTKASVSIVVRVFAYNPNNTGGYDGAGGDYLYGQANINGSNGFALPLAVSGNGGSGTNNSPFSKILTGLTSGDSISLQIAASTSFAGWAANAANVAEVSGSIAWYR